MTYTKDDINIGDVFIVSRLEGTMTREIYIIALKNAGHESREKLNPTFRAIVIGGHGDKPTELIGLAYLNNYCVKLS